MSYHCHSSVHIQVSLLKPSSNQYVQNPALWSPALPGLKLFAQFPLQFPSNILNLTQLQKPFRMYQGWLPPHCAGQGTCLLPLPLQAQGCYKPCPFLIPRSTFHPFKETQIYMATSRVEVLSYAKVWLNIHTLLIYSLCQQSAPTNTTELRSLFHASLPC